MEILVVGAGDMGRWLGRALREDAPDPVDLAFADRDDAAASDAAAAVGGRTVSTDTDERFDGVCLAVPIPAVSDAVAAYAEQADRAMFDVSGTMRTPIRAMHEHAPDCERASLHPLFAPTNEPGNVPLVVDEGGPVVDTVRETLAARGNDCFETTPDEHDQAMETVQARTHAAVLAYALAAEDIDERFHTPISAGLDDLAQQVTSGEARVYADIQTAFDGADDVAEAARRIAAADDAAFEQLYTEASER
jgi:prephenate dehydrogenase